jgi:predicted PurR-regulated permease PerM
MKMPAGSPAPAASQTRVALQVLAVIAAVAAGLWTLHRLAPVVLAVVVAALCAYTIAPLVQLAGREFRIAGRAHRLSRAAAIAVVYVLISGTVVGVAALLLPSATEQVNDLIQRSPAYAQSILTWEHGWSRYYKHLSMPVEVRQSLDQSALAAEQAGIDTIRASLLALVGALSYLPWLVLIPILAFFLLKDAATLRRAVVRAFPRHDQLRGHRLFEDLNATLAAYTRAQLLACVFVGTVCGLGFALLGVPYPLVLGILAGILEFIPLVGPVVLAVIAVAISALHAPMLALWAVGFLGVLRVIEDYVVYPRLIRHGLRLHPLAVILTVLGGAELGGIVGMFLAVPSAAIVSVVYRHWVDWRTNDQADSDPIPLARAK